MLHIYQIARGSHVHIPLQVITQVFDLGSYWAIPIKPLIFFIRYCAGKESEMSLRLSKRGLQVLFQNRLVFGAIYDSL